MTAPQAPRGRNPAGAILFIVFAIVLLLLFFVLFGISPLGLLAAFR